MTRFVFVHLTGMKRMDEGLMASSTQVVLSCVSPGRVLMYTLTEDLSLREEYLCRLEGQITK